MLTAHPAGARSGPLAREQALRGRVAIFTDCDFDEISALSTTLKAVLRYAPPDIQPRIYTFADLEIDAPQYLVLKCPFVPLPFHASRQVYVPRLGRLRYQLRADDVQVIHLTTPGPAGLTVRYLSRRIDTPIIGSVHTRLSERAVRDGSGRFGSLINQYLKWVYGACERVLVPSMGTGQRLAAHGWTAERLAVWPRGVDAETFSPERRSISLRERWRVSDRRPAILYAGRLSDEKGLGMLDALTSQLHRSRTSHRFIIVGEGPMMAELREKMPDAVFTGRLPHDQVAVSIASADVFVLPGGTQTTGSVILEAQACGLPVVASGATAVEENMVHGDTGFVCDPGDAFDFSSRLGQLLSEPRFRAVMGARARSYAARRAWAVSLAPLFESYRTAMAFRTRDSQHPIPTSHGSDGHRAQSLGVVSWKLGVEHAGESRPPGLAGPY